MNNYIFRRELVCLSCGNIDVIQRVKGHFKSYGHIKDLWCYKCKKNTKHYEIIDKTSFFYSQFNDEISLYVKSLLWPDHFSIDPKKSEKVKKLIL